jgi:hypothetical protein
VSSTSYPKGSSHGEVIEGEVAHSDLLAVSTCYSKYRGTDIPHHGRKSSYPFPSLVEEH